VKLSLWRAYAAIWTLVFLISVWLIGSSNQWSLAFIFIDVLPGLVFTVGVWAYSLKVRIFRLMFWRVIAVLAVATVGAHVWHLANIAATDASVLIEIQPLRVEEDGIAFFNPLAEALFLLPGYIALYLYGVDTQRLWPREEGKTEARA
jgi:hypothetical protein